MLALTYELNYILPKVLLAAEKKTFRVILLYCCYELSMVVLLIEQGLVVIQTGSIIKGRRLVKKANLFYLLLI